MRSAQVNANNICVYYKYIETNAYMIAAKMQHRIFLSGKAGAFSFLLPDKEETMNQLDKNIAVNLKRIRKSKNMSLDMLAERTGVSKSMLGQIERGESNPTVATIAKIVTGIRISFEELIYPRKESVLIIDNEKLPIYKSEEGAYQVRSVFPYDRHREFEVYEVRVEPGGSCGCFLEDGADCEYIIVIQGTLTLETEEGTYEVAASHAIKLDASNAHGYHNYGSQRLILNIFTV